MHLAEPLFVAGHPGLDFLNTRFVDLATGVPLEAIGDGDAFAAWLRGAGLLKGAPKLRSTGKALDDAATEARKLREWASDWILRWSRDPRGDFSAEIERLNRLLSRVSYAKRVSAVGGSLELLEEWRVDAMGDLVGLLASQLSLLITAEKPELVKRCDGEGCVLWFLDRTKAHRRRFCSAAVCGNRSKVAAFRERERAQR